MCVKGITEVIAMKALTKSMTALPANRAGLPENVHACKCTTIRQPPFAPTTNRTGEKNANSRLGNKKDDDLTTHDTFALPKPPDGFAEFPGAAATE